MQKNVLSPLFAVSCYTTYLYSTDKGGGSLVVKEPGHSPRYGVGSLEDHL